MTAMTTAVHLAPRPAGAPGMRVTQRRVLNSEWTKFRSLRSTLYTLATAVALTIGIGALISAVTASQFGTFDAAQQASFDPTFTSLAGVTFSQLAIGVLGVLLISGEYSTGMIRSSLTAVPGRLAVLWGKLAVFAGVVLVVSLGTSFATFFLGQSLLGDHGVSLSADGALRSVVGSALYVTVAGMIGVALGALLRNTAAGVSVFVGAFFVIPPLTLLLPASMSAAIDPYLPSNAGGALFGAGGTDALSPWVGFALLCGYAVLMIGAAAIRLRRTDA